MYICNKDESRQCTCNVDRTVADVATVPPVFRNGGKKEHDKPEM